jgi:hypothetical protein
VTNTTPAPSQWLRDTIAAHNAIRDAIKVLSEPVPPDLPIADAIAVRQCVAWRPTLAEQLRSLSLPTIAREVVGGAAADVASYAGSCAGEARRETVGSVLSDYLAGIEQDIARRLRAGESADAILTNDFGGKIGDGLLLVTERTVSSTTPYLAGLLHRLPATHPARGITPDAFATDAGPALILGPMPQNAAPRKWYSYDRIGFWTWTLCKAQGARLAAKPLFQLTDAEIRQARQREAQVNRLPPPPPSLPPSPPAEPLTWTEAAVRTLTVLPKVEKLFRPPPASAPIPLPDLLAARALFVRSDGPEGEDEPVMAHRPIGQRTAAVRWAGRFCGATRHEELMSAVGSLIQKLDLAIDNYVAAGMYWAAQRYESLEAELAAMRAELDKLNEKRIS